MKLILSFCCILIAFIYFGCDDNATGSGSSGALDGGGTGGVTFTVALAQDQQQQTYFEFKPSTNIVLTQVTANCAAANVNNEVVQGDGATVYTPTEPFYIGPVANLQKGQQWTFAIQGKLGNAQGQAYNVNANFTVP